MTIFISTCQICNAKIRKFFSYDWATVSNLWSGDPNPTAFPLERLCWLAAKYRTNLKRWLTLLSTYFLPKNCKHGPSYFFIYRKVKYSKRKKNTKEASRKAWRTLEQDKLFIQEERLLLREDLNLCRCSFVACTKQNFQVLLIFHWIQSSWEQTLTGSS